MIAIDTIFVSSSGFEQTNVSFYQVVKASPTSITLRKIAKNEQSDGPQSMTGTATPRAGEFTGEAFRRKLHQYEGSSFVRVSDYAYAYQWDGKAKRWSSYG